MKILGGIIAVLCIAGGVYFFATQAPSFLRHDSRGVDTQDVSPMTTSTSDLSTPAEASLPDAPEFVRPQGFLNTEPFTLADVRGDVVLVLFWTFGCVNCQRTMPHMNALYEKYHDQGFTIVGVHTPEFAYEHKKENVAAALQEQGIAFPVILDNNYDTWRAYGNRYWPRRYLINRDGQIVYDHIGEGAYAETAQRVQVLLAAP